VIVTKHFRVGWLDRLWQSSRARSGVGLVSQGEVVARCLPALRDGQVVAMMIDQAPERARAVIEVPFLGQRAAVDLAPALLALRARVPLVAAFPIRRADGKHSLEVAAVIEPPSRTARGWAVDAMTAITAHLEHHVRRYPDQWLWMHRRWKRVEGGG
jgi:KDO2-lipid IV(A) lauroyltransferase